MAKPFVSPILQQQPADDTNPPHSVTDLKVQRQAMFLTVTHTFLCGCMSPIWTHSVMHTHTHTHSDTHRGLIYDIEIIILIIRNIWISFKFDLQVITLVSPSPTCWTAYFEFYCKVSRLLNFKCAYLVFQSFLFVLQFSNSTLDINLWCLLLLQVPDNITLRRQQVRKLNV